MVKTVDKQIVTSGDETYYELIIECDNTDIYIVRVTKEAYLKERLEK